MKAAYQNVRIEMKGIRQADARAKWESAAAQHQVAIAAIDGRYQEAARVLDSAAAGGGEDGGGGGGSAAAEVAATRENYRAAVETQQDSMEVLRRARRYGVEADQVGAAAQSALAAQTERIHEIRDTAKVLESNVKRAQRDVLYFFRTAGTDKCFLLLFGLLVIGVVVVVVWQLWLKDYLAVRGNNPLRLRPYTVTAVPAVPTVPAVPALGGVKWREGESE